MTDYKNLSEQSNVSRYQIGSDFIIVEFQTINNDGCNTYKYTYKSAGKNNIEEMKKLATAGKGLNSFINKYTRKDYERKW